MVWRLLVAPELFNEGADGGCLNAVGKDLKKFLVKLDGFGGLALPFEKPTEILENDLCIRRAGKLLDRLP